MVSHEWKEFDPLSVAKIMGLMMVVIGFFIGLIFALVGTTFGGVLGPGFGLASIIVVPLLYGIMGFVGGAIYAIIYNFVAKKIGGIRVKI